MKWLHIVPASIALALLASACQTPAPLPEPQPPPQLAQEVHKPPAPAAPVATAKEKPQEVVSKAPIDRTLPESLIAAPAKNLASRSIDYGTMLSSRAAHSKPINSWQYRRTRQGQIVGFEFSNHGGNSILTPRRDATKNQFFTRDFQFRFDDRARQDIHLMISDWVASRDRMFRLSGLMHSLMHFFPRSYLPAIVNAGDNNIVTLPTGEEVEFNAFTKEIRGGVLAESPVDLTPDRNGRKYPAVTYQGQGVLVRADARGADPRLGTTATISAGTPPSSCDKPEGCRQCEVPSKELWDQSGAVRFKFQTDQDFDRYLTARCGFGLPRLGTEFAVTAPQS
ncbi:MAG: hypothetical protein M3N35_12670 [Candidatus Binatota bacterium]|nr:hypothetical protein [Candidatus Binatota bacterium]